MIVEGRRDSVDYLGFEALSFRGRGLMLDHRQPRSD